MHILVVELEVGLSLLLLGLSFTTRTVEHGMNCLKCKVGDTDRVVFCSLILKFESIETIEFGIFDSLLFSVFKGNIFSNFSISFSILLHFKVFSKDSLMYFCGATF